MYPTLIPAVRTMPRRMARLRALAPTNRRPAVPLPVTPAKTTAPTQPVSPTAAATSSVLRQVRVPTAAAAPQPSSPNAAVTSSVLQTAAASTQAPTAKPIGGPIAAARQNAPSGYCVFTSSPETGGVSSVEPCTAGPGGTPISGPLPTGYCVNPGNPANGTNPTVGPCTGAAGQVPVGTTPALASTGYVPPAGTPPGYPSDIVGQVAIPAGTIYNGVPYSGTGLEDANGDIWVYANGAWTNIGPGGTETGTSIGATAATTAVSTVSSPVPSTQPTNQPYVDSEGNIWTYNASTGQWQITGNVSSALADSEYSQYAAAAGSPAVPAGAPSSGGDSSGGGYQAIISWLDSDSLINGVQNFWILGAAVVGVYLLKNREARR